MYILSSQSYIYIYCVQAVKTEYLLAVSACQMKGQSQTRMKHLFSWL